MADMTLAALKSQVMFQTNNDDDDVSEFLPHLVGYLNEGYDLLVLALTDEHLEADAYMADDPDTMPLIPVWAQPAVADYGTWMVYRNGNPSKQQRGMQFLRAFNEVRARLSALHLKGKQFYNLD